MPIITSPFLPTARALAKLQGIEDFPLVDVAHPITSLNSDELRERARDAAPRIAAILMGTA